MTDKIRLDILLNQGLTYSSDIAASLLHIDEPQLIILAQQHGLAYRMVEWNDGEIQCLRIGTKAEKHMPLRFNAGIAFSAAVEDSFWLEV